MQADADHQREPRQTQPMPNGAAIAPRSWRRAHPLAFGALVGLGGAMLIAVVALVVIALIGRTPQLTRAQYEAAAARWDANGPESYDLDLELTGRRAGKIHVEVRDGEVTHMIRDGVEPRQKRTWYYWTVPGMFDTIEQELDMAQDPAVSYGDRRASQVVMRAEFDPRYGYPARFDRVVLGVDLEVHWKVTDFRVVSGKSPAPGGVGGGR